MKKAMLGTLLLLAAALVPGSARAQVAVSVGVNIPLPPPVVFSAPPEVVAIPETNVYAVPDVEADIFFSQGWWWRPWEGRWYRSRYYDRGWGFYRQAPPPFYRNVPPGWRNDYRDHRWRGREWNHERIAHGDLQRNWRGWQNDKHWQHRGIRGMEPRPVGPMGHAQRMDRRPGGPMPMRGPQPGPQGQPQRGMRDREYQGPRGQPGQDGRGFQQPRQQGPRGGGPMGGPSRGPSPGRGHEDRGGPGRR